MQWELQMRGRTLSVSRTWRRWSRERRFRIAGLDPEFITHYPAAALQGLIFSSLAGLFVWLAVENDAPYTSPIWILAGVCLAGLLLSTKRSKEGRTVIKYTDGSYAFVLEHQDFDAEELQTFLGELRTQILEASPQ
jgi:hypothetical protein